MIREWVKSNWKLLLVFIGILFLVLFYYEVLPTLNQKQKDIGKVELVNQIMLDGVIPINYLYCVGVDWEKEEERLKEQLETQIENETERNTEVEKQIEDIKEMCEIQELYIITQTKESFCQSEYQRGQVEGYQYCKIGG